MHPFYGNAVVKAHLQSVCDTFGMKYGTICSTWLLIPHAGAPHPESNTSSGCVCVSVCLRVCVCVQCELQLAGRELRLQLEGFLRCYKFCKIIL